MPDQLETTLATLTELCWQCRLVEWLGGLEQDAAVSLIVGVLNAGVIVGAAWFATKKVSDIYLEKKSVRSYELSEAILRFRYSTRENFVSIRSPLFQKPTDWPEGRFFSLANSVVYHLPELAKHINNNLEEISAPTRIHFEAEVYEKLLNFRVYAWRLYWAATDTAS